jgi:hypothetical protein
VGCRTPSDARRPNRHGSVVDAGHARRLLGEGRTPVRHRRTGTVAGDGQHRIAARGPNAAADPCGTLPLLGADHDARRVPTTPPSRTRPAHPRCHRWATSAITATVEALPGRALSRLAFGRDPWVLSAIRSPDDRLVFGRIGGRYPGVSIKVAASFVQPQAMGRTSPMARVTVVVDTEPAGRHVMGAAHAAMDRSRRRVQRSHRASAQ